MGASRQIKQSRLTGRHTEDNSSQPVRSSKELLHWLNPAQQSALLRTCRSDINKHIFVKLKIIWILCLFSTLFANWWYLCDLYIFCITWYSRRLCAGGKRLKRTKEAKLKGMSSEWRHTRQTTKNKWHSAYSEALLQSSTEWMSEFQSARVSMTSMYVLVNRIAWQGWSPQSARAGWWRLLCVCFCEYWRGSTKKMPFFSMHVFKNDN